MPEQHGMEVDLIHVARDSFCATLEELDKFLGALDSDVYRVKGFIVVDGKPVILNWAFGRYTLTEHGDGTSLLLTVMGLDLILAARKCKTFFGQDSVTLNKSTRHSH
jgi:hypothetical protein